MSLELINAIASVVTALVIGATAIAAMVQLRHMRMNNQISALLAVQNEFDARDYRDADILVRKEFPTIFEDEKFCRYMIDLMNDRELVENPRYLQARLAARLVANTYENLGAMVKRSILDPDLFLDVYSWIISTAWDNLGGFVALVRSAASEPTLFENFEYIASLSRDYLATGPSSFPPGAKRLDPQIPTPAVGLLALERLEGTQRERVVPAAMR